MAQLILTDRQKDTEALATICSFLAWAHADGNQLYGGRRAGEVIAAFSQISGLTVDQIQEVGICDKRHPNEPD